MRGQQDAGPMGGHEGGIAQKTRRQPFTTNPDPIPGIQPPNDDKSVPIIYKPLHLWLLLQ